MTTAAFHPSSHPPARILMVDDNANGLAARKAVLEELGHNVTTTTAPEHALALFSAGKVDLVVTDYKMPKMDGVELIRRVREIEPGIPVIVLSGYVDAFGLNEENTGADAVLPKSASEISQLIRAVNRLRRRRPAKKPPASHPPALKAKRTHA